MASGGINGFDKLGPAEVDRAFKLGLVELRKKGYKMDPLSYWVAVAFVVGLTLIGMYDLYVLWWNPGVHTTVTWEVRHSWMRYLMAFNIGGFLLLHFWPRGGLPVP